MDLELEIRADKWDVAMKELETGGIDLLPMMAYSPERDEIFDFSVPHTIAYDAIFLRKGSTGIRTMKDLSGKTVLVMNKDIAHSYLLSSGLSKTMTLNLVDSLPDALKQLSAGKGDAAIMPKLVGIVTAKKLNLSEIETSPQLIDAYTRPFSFAVKAGNLALLERLNQGLNIIKSSGEYDVIYKKWFGALEDPHLNLKIVKKYGSAAALILFGFIIWNIVLKRQVRAKTEHLLKEIAERKRTEEQLLESKERLQLATQAATVGIWDWDVPNNKLTWDDSMFTIYGIHDGDFSGVFEAWSSMVPEEDRQYAVGEIQAALRGEREYDIVHRIVRPDGTIRFIKVGSKAYFDDNGKPLRIIGTNVDITDLKHAEDSLRSLIEWTPVATIVHREGVIIYANPVAIRMFGATSEQDLLEKPFLDLIHKDFHQISLARKSITDQGIRIPMIEYIFLKPDGTIFYGEIQSTNFEYEGNRAHISCIIDISDRKKVEEEKHTLEHQMQQTQKLESLGVLSGGIAHDFNNILAIIMGYCSLTKMDYETAENNILEIEKAAERAAALCRQMLAYAGKAQLTKAQVNMWTLVDEMASMLKTTLPQNAEIKLDLSADIPFINADASQLRQVVMNLIINASEAIGKEHGEIHVSLARTTVTDGQATKDYHGISIPFGEYVCLEVTDNGCGMDEETKWRIFEPFYTTKFTGRGLGMSAVLGIINSHGGALQLHSQLGQGTTFKVYLPVQKSDSARDENISASVPSAPWRGNGTILLVEDEDQVRLITKALLKNFGFSVLEAVNGKEALELYQKNATDITLVMTDMGMPIMDGYELFSELKKLNPELPIIVSSGYGDSEVGSRIGIDNIAGLISKPYGPDQLREVLKRVVG